MRFTPQSGNMAGTLTDAPAFPGAAFHLGMPENIGDASWPTWFTTLKPTWSQDAAGLWRAMGRAQGELSYELTVTPHDDFADVDIRLTNESARAWKQGMAFNCFGCGAAPLRDNECLRHWVGVAGKPRRLISLPRVFSPRPTVQVYNVAGAPPAREMAFPAVFQATPDVVVDGWMAVVAPDGKRLAAVVSKPALFLFQNMEYSCIHSAPGFGPMAPGETRAARTRLYMVEAPLSEWHRRMTAEMGAA